MILVFDVGGTFIKWALTNNDEIIEKGKVETPKDTFENFLKAIEPIVKKYDQLEALAFSLPGVMNQLAGIIHIGGAIRYLDGRHFTKEVGDYFNLPVTIENDCNAACLAEVEMGHLKGVDHGLVIVVGNGIGSAYVYKGQVLRGAHGYGGENSFLPTEKMTTFNFSTIFGEVCGMSPFLRKASEVLNIPNLDGIQLMQLVEDQNKQAVAMIDDYMATFANMIYILQIAYDPAVTVIGGGISANPLYMELLSNKVETLFKTVPVPMPYGKVVAGTYYNDSNLIGALVSYHRQVEGRY